MNKTLTWAFAGACLTGIVGCRLAPPRQNLPSPVSSATYSEAADCSGLSGHDRLEVRSAPPIQTQARIPYAYRWDEYQGSDIEHDIYGDRQRAASLRAITHPHLVPEVARTLHGLLATPGHKSCAAPHCASSPTRVHGDECGCEKAIVPPVPPPLTIVPPTPEVEQPAAEQPTVDPQTSKLIPAEPSPEVQTPVEPVPMDPTPAEPAPAVRPAVPPRNVVPRSLPQSSISPSTTDPEASSNALDESPKAAIPPAPLPSTQRKTANRLIPTVIVSAMPPSPFADTPRPEAPRKELRRNKIPANPPQESKED